MGIFKNEVGRPTNKKILTRKILRFLLIIIIVITLIYIIYIHNIKKDDISIEKYNKIGNIALPLNKKQICSPNIGVEIKYNKKTSVFINYYKNSIKGENANEFLKEKILYKNDNEYIKRKYIGKKKLKNGIIIGKYKSEFWDYGESGKTMFPVDYEIDYIYILGNDVYSIIFYSTSKFTKDDEKKIDNIIMKTKKLDYFYDFTKDDSKIDEYTNPDEIIYEKNNIFRYGILKLDLSKKFKAVKNKSYMFYNYEKNISFSKLNINELLAETHNTYNVNSLKFYYDNFKLFEDKIFIREIVDKKYIETQDFDMLYFNYNYFSDAGNSIVYYINPKNTSDVYEIELFEVEKLDNKSIDEIKQIYKNITICSKTCTNENCSCK